MGGAVLALCLSCRTDVQIPRVTKIANLKSVESYDLPEIAWAPTLRNTLMSQNCATADKYTGRRLLLHSNIVACADLQVAGGDLARLVIAGQSKVVATDFKILDMIANQKLERTDV
jgi:hypothetical protein